MSDFYDHTGFPSTGSAGLSAAMRAEFAKLQTAFGKFPSLTGNDGKPLVVAGGGSTIGVTTGTLTLSGNFIKGGADSLTLTTTGATSLTLPTSGTLATRAGVETLSNKTIDAATINAPTISSPVFSGASAAGTLQGSYTLVSSTTSGYAIGTTVASNTAMVWGFSKTGPGSSTVYGLLASSSLTGGVADVITGYGFALPTVFKAGSGTHANIETVFIGAPSISGAATATNASSLRIVGAPASGATNLYAVKVDAGTTQLGGLLDLSPAAAGQIKFPASQNASADANTLDDYEEGTWTPSVGGSASYVTRTGNYTKIGRMVFIQCLLTINLIGTGSTGTISGLPFTAATGDFALSVGDFTNLPSNMVSVVARVNSGAATIKVEGLSAAAAAPNVAGVIGNGTYLLIAGCYHV